MTTTLNGVNAGFVATGSDATEAAVSVTALASSLAASLLQEITNSARQLAMIAENRFIVYYLIIKK